MKKLIAGLVGISILLGGLTIGYTQNPANSNTPAVNQSEKEKDKDNKKCGKKMAKKKAHKKAKCVVTPEAK